MSKKHGNKPSHGNPPSNNPTPPQQCKFENRSVYPVRIEPTTEDNQWKTDQKTNWGRQLTVAKVLNYVTATAAVVGLIYGAVNFGMWMTMKDANKLSQQAFRVSQRSYISIGRKDGVIASFVSSNDPKQKAELVMYFQNSGRLPANLAWGTLGMNFLEGAPNGQTSSGITYTHPFKGMSRTKDRKTGTMGGNGESTIVAGDSIFVARIGEIPPGRTR